MTMNREEIEAILRKAKDGLLNMSPMETEFARLALSLMDQLADAQAEIADRNQQIVDLGVQSTGRLRALIEAQAAQAAMVERAVSSCSVAGVDEEDEFDRGYGAGRRSAIAAIRALAPDAGTQELARIKAERDEYKKLAVAGNLVALEMRIVEADRDRLAAELAEARAQVEKLLAAIDNFIPTKKGGLRLRAVAEETRAALTQPATPAGTPGLSPRPGDQGASGQP